MESQNLMVENMVKTHRRVFIATIIIEVLANLATLGIYFSGTGSSELTMTSILYEIGAAVIIYRLPTCSVRNQPRLGANI